MELKKESNQKMELRKENGMILDGHKLDWHRERIDAWMRGEKIAPITIDCALTRSCNYGCVYCYAILQENQGKHLSKDVIFNFLSDCAEIGVKAISFMSDGESQCSPHVYDAIVYGKSVGLDMSIGTNGALLKKEKLPEILPCLTYLRFNVSAGEPKKYADIHGTTEEDFYKVKEVVKECVRIKKEKNLGVTIGLQMVLLPHYVDQIIPLTKLGKELGVDYLVIKHCSDDELGSLGVNYDEYFNEDLKNTIYEAEGYSDENYLVKAKWSKLLSGGKRKYTQCYGAPFLLQISGSGLVAPCGPFFNDRYKDKFHIGNIAEKSFKEIWESDRYWEVMNHISSTKFNAKKECGTLCTQHNVNEYLWDVKRGAVAVEYPQGEAPEHVNYI